MTFEITSSFISTLIKIGIVNFIFGQTIFKVPQINFFLLLFFVLLIILFLLLINWRRWVKK